MKHAFRSLAKSPGFTAVVILTLALGIGATTTVFSWIERVLLNPLPGVADPSRIVALETTTPSGGMIDSSYPDFRDYQAQAQSLSGIAVAKARALTLGTSENAERVWAELTSGNFFELLGVRPRLGRFFVGDDHADDAAAKPVVVIAESLWRRRFNADPHVLGRTLKLNQQEFTVIGVAPVDFLGSMNGLGFDAWVPVTLHARLMGPSSWLVERRWRALSMFGRLAPHATLESARTEIAGIAGRLAASYPEANRGVGLAVLPVARSPHGAHHDLGLPLLLLLGVSVLVLLIVCANVSNLLLVRASAREREMCIRQALGAGRGRLVRQLFVETLLVTGAGATLGLLCTLWMSGLMQHFIPTATLPIALTASISSRVLVTALALSIGTALLAGLAPALWASRPNLVDVLRAAGRSAGFTPKADRFRRFLVIAQVATALVTLACAALAAKSFRAARETHPGFDAHGVLLGVLRLDTSGFSRDQATAFYERLQEQLGGLPGVSTAAVAENVPLGLDAGSWEEVTAPGYAPAPQTDDRIYRNLVSPGYFELMHIPLLSGREFTAADRRGAQDVAIVNEAFARRFLNTTEAVGRRFSVWGGKRQLTVVGVVKTTKIHRLDESPKPFYYVPVPQFLQSDTGLAVHLRTSGDPLTLLPALRTLVRSIDPRVPVFEALTLEDYVSTARFAQKATASLLAVLSVIALALTSLGLYGVLAFSVVQRTAEFGVRLALGAQPTAIVGLVLGRGARLIVTGLILGLIGAFAAARGAAHLFFGIEPFEPGLIALVTVIVTGASVLACWLPARRAARVDPAVALRAE